MKTIFVTIFLFFIPFMLCAQTVTYTYDNAGNRIRREIVMQQNAPAKRALPSTFSDIFEEKTVHIYPNPTSGVLKVSVSGYESTDNIRYSILNVAGQQIVDATGSSATTTLNISSQPNGVYLLHIVVNGQERTWKIIKK